MVPVAAWNAASGRSAACGRGRIRPASKRHRNPRGWHIARSAGSEGREQFQHLSPSSPLQPALSDLLSRMGSRPAAPTITCNVPDESPFRRGEACLALSHMRQCHRRATHASPLRRIIHRASYCCGPLPSSPHRAGVSRLLQMKLRIPVWRVEDARPL